MSYEVVVRVKEVRGRCAAGYSEGDSFSIIGFCIEGRVCIHALSSMLTLLSPFLKGIKAELLGIGSGDLGYVQCPDPGPPYTCGGTVIFELERRLRDF
jgi:uncharacterized repeat protein (TIGR04076 family)